MKNTVFTEKHIALGAKMAPFAGYNMPIQYKGINEEHACVREGVGVFDVSHMGEIWIKGPKALAFLQYVSSNDASVLFPGKAQYTCFPNGKGGIVDDFIAYCFSTEKYLLAVNAANIEKDWNHLCAIAPKFGLEVGKDLVNGTPIRQELFMGTPEKGMEFCGFREKRPTVLVIGGSTGSAAVNGAVWNALDRLLTEYNVIHICGKDKTDESKNGKTGYVQYEYVKQELADLFALADVIISRAGANAICELLALRKPNILIPLSKAQSRGDQILNARSFEKSGYSKVIEEEDLTTDVLIDAVHEVFEKKDTYIEAMSHTKEKDAITIITEMIDQVSDEPPAKKRRK